MNLRARILAGERLVGCFVKTPAPQVVEVLGLGGLDFVVADREHAPIGTQTIDLMAMAGRSVDLPVLIRSRNAQADEIWPALDMGCAGVMVPHIRGAAEAAKVADSTEHMRWDMYIHVMEPNRRLVWDWPAFDPSAFPDDPDSNARLTVEIAIAPEGDSTRLTLRESGFADLPEGPALAVWQRNEGGWTMQLDNIAAHVAA